MIPHIKDFKSIAHARRYLQANNKTFSDKFVEFGGNTLHPLKDFFKAIRNRDFCVQLFHQMTEEFGLVVRMSVNRTNINSQGKWEDGITWDELQKVKSGCGYGECMAIEIYPEDSELVTDANMRHLFILNSRLSFGWTREKNAAQ
jgi:hypothetical protein